MRKRVVRTSSDLPRSHWIARQLAPGTSLRPYVEDGAASAIVGALVDAIRKSGIPQKEVAEAMGVTEGSVSQVMHGRRANMTVKSLGAYLWAIGYEIDTVTLKKTGAVRTLRRQRSASEGK